MKLARALTRRSFFFACRGDDDEGSHFEEADPLATSTDDQSGIPAKNNW